MAKVSEAPNFPDKPFRMQEPAHRISSMLNSNGGNGEDVRIRRIFEAYDTHVRLMKEYRGLKRQRGTGANVAVQLTETRDKLEEVNYMLGI